MEGGGGDLGGCVSEDLEDGDDTVIFWVGGGEGPHCVGGIDDGRGKVGSTGVGWSWRPPYVASKGGGRVAA